MHFYGYAKNACLVPSFEDMGLWGLEILEKY